MRSVNLRIIPKTSVYTKKQTELLEAEFQKMGLNPKARKLSSYKGHVFHRGVLLYGSTWFSQIKRSIIQHRTCGIEK
jgi:hypothetical protein